MPEATEGAGGPETDSGRPPRPHPPAPAMDPLVPSCEPSSWSGERCFLRQPWPRPLQLEHSGGVGRGTGPGGGSWALGTPSPLFGPRPSTPQTGALKPQWTSMAQPPAPGRRALCEPSEGGGQGAEGALPQNLRWGPGANSAPRGKGNGNEFPIVSNSQGEAGRPGRERETQGAGR